MRLKLLPLTVSVCAAFASLNVNALSYSGYGRSGIAETANGGEQFCFKLDGVNFKYRLGNECETYWEVRLDQDLVRTQGYLFNVATLWVMQTPQQIDFEKTDEGVDDEPINNFGRSEIVPREMFFQSQQLTGWARGSNFWAGKRFFQRHDVHMIDYYYFSDGTPGGGWENINVGLGRLSVSWLRAAENVYVRDKRTGEFRPEKEAIPNSQIDIRWAGLPVTKNGELEVALLYGYNSTPQKDALIKGAPGEGWLGYAEWTQGNLFGGFNKAVFQAAEGCFAQVEINFARGDFTEDEVNEIAANTTARDLKNPQMLGRCFGASRNVIDDEDPWSFRFLDWGAFDFNERFGMLYVGMWEHAEGDEGDRDYTVDHFSVGARFAYNWGRIMSSQIEVGFSYLDREMRGSGSPDNDSNVETAMAKITFAPLVWKANKAIFARPEVRVLATYANWNEHDALTAGEDEEKRFFGNSREGWTFGLQSEAWF